MAIDAVSKTCGSFLYAGCYRARGTLTCADRAAWGLQEPIRRYAAHPSQQPVAGSKSALHARAAVRTDFGELRFSLLGTRSPGFRSGRPTHRIACSTPSIIRYAKRFAALRAASTSHRTLAWRRIRAKVDGVKVTCLVFRGRVFVHGGALASEPPRD